jgi:hypothetical protein
MKTLAMAAVVAAISTPMAAYAEHSIGIDTFEIGFDIRTTTPPFASGGGEVGNQGGLTGIFVSDAVHYSYHTIIDPNAIHPEAQVEWDITHYWRNTGSWLLWSGSKTYISGSAFNFSQETWTTAPMETGTSVVTDTPPGVSPCSWRQYVFTLKLYYTSEGHSDDLGNIFPTTQPVLDTKTRSKRKDY